MCYQYICCVFCTHFLFAGGYMNSIINEIYPKMMEDRRIAPHVPSRTASRRGVNTRFYGAFNVKVSEKKIWSTGVDCKCVNLSRSGMLLEYSPGAKCPQVGDKRRLNFFLPPGTMPEGYEANVVLEGRVVRVDASSDKPKIALAFNKDLERYMYTGYWPRAMIVALFVLSASLMGVFYLREASIFYFLFNVPVFLYSMVASSFLLSRYLFASFYRNVPVDPEYTPGVSVIIPCYNEETWIQRTIQSCLNQDYPEDKLEVILVDDGSTDQSMQQVRAFEKRIRDEMPNANFTAVQQPRNMGKRHALARGTLRAKFDLVVFVDSDSFLAPTAIRELVQPFVDPKMGAVTGRTEVHNKWTNYLTKMQAVRYYVSFRFFKAAESVFDAVTCLSGPLACYRKRLVLQHLDAWCTQTFLGKPATFGDDRSMTNFILATERTGYQDAAVCHTVVPSSLRIFLKQQMRWKRSWLRESIRAASFMWRKEPFMALSFYIGLLLPVLAPIIVVNALLVQPMYNGAFPLVYLGGIALMSLLMSAAYLLFKKSRLWLYGFWFCLFYLAVLMWQMPWAILTFSTAKWGTRSTALDVAGAGPQAPMQVPLEWKTEEDVVAEGISGNAGAI